jgi:hypothetical protein
MTKQQSDAASPALSKAKKPRQFPVEIWAGGSVIRILHDPLHIPIRPRVGETPEANRAPAKKKYDPYLVEYDYGSKPLRKRRSKYEKARALADQIKVKLLNNEVDATRLVGRDQEVYLAAAEHLKGDLGLRPNYHQLEGRGDAHIFLTVLAYQLLRFITYSLEQKGDHRDWPTLRRVLQTHCYATVSLPTRNGNVLHVRRPGTPENCYHQI